MYQNDPIIIWQKWIDPFFGNDDDVTDSDWLEPNYSDIDSQLENEEEEEKEHNSPNKKPIKVIATPMGIIPMNEHTASGKIFNFWIGHTNFDITQKVLSIIESTDGVESLDIFTRYRFRIAVGKAFDDSIIMREINNRVYEHINT
jgi:hypothetical protein